MASNQSSGSVVNFSALATPRLLVDTHLLHAKVTLLLDACQIVCPEMASTRTRLPPEQRRAQLLDVAAEAFAALPYQDVLMSDVANEAGVSRALLYRYYPTKRDLFAAVYEVAARRLVETSAVPTPTANFNDEVLAGLDAHFDFFEANTRTVLVANRGELAGDPVIEAIISNQLADLRKSMLDALHLDGHEREVASVALHGWLSFIRAVCVEWLVDDIVSRSEVRDMCLKALLGLLTTEPTSNMPATI